MRNYTIQDIFKIIPLEDETRNTFLKEFNTYDDAKKYEIESVCTGAFVELTDKLSEIKYEQFLNEVQKGTKELTTDLMIQARQAVHADYENILNGKTQETQQIDEIRSKLQSLSKVVGTS